MSHAARFAGNTCSQGRYALAWWGHIHLIRPKSLWSIDLRIGLSDYILPLSGCYLLPLVLLTVYWQSPWPSNADTINVEHGQGKSLEVLFLIPPSSTCHRHLHYAVSWLTLAETRASLSNDGTITNLLVVTGYNDSVVGSTQFKS